MAAQHFGDSKAIIVAHFFRCYILSYLGVTHCNSTCVCPVFSKQALTLQFNFQHRKQCQLIFLSHELHSWK